MKIVNNTEYDTRRLRTMVCAVHKYIAKTEGRLPQWGELAVEFDYCKARKGCPLGRYRANGNGRAWYHNISIRLPRGFTYAFVLADLLQHELYHLYGYKHPISGSPRKYTVPGAYKIGRPIAITKFPCLVIREGINNVPTS